MAWLRRIAGALMVAALIYGCWSLATANSAPVTVNLLVGEFVDVAQWRVLLVAFASGAGMAGLVLLYEIVKAWLMRRRYRRRVAELESEVHQLRNMPLAADPGATVPTGAPNSGA